MRKSIGLLVCIVALLAVPAFAQEAEPPKPEENPYKDCAEKPLADCFWCCAEKGSAARAACTQHGFSKEYCEELAEKVVSDCMNRGCGVKAKALTSEQISDGLSTFLLGLQQEALAQ